MNALLALHPCKAFGRSTSGIHARPRKRVRFCCSVKPSQLWWGLLPIRTINEIFRTIPITKLASLVKGRWIDGKAQALILLLSVCDTPTFFIYQTFLPSRRRDCHSTNPPKTALSLENRPHPRLACPSRCTEYCYLRIDLSYSIY